MTSKRLLVSTVLLTGSVFGMVNFSSGANAANVCNNYDRDKGKLTGEVELNKGFVKVTNTSNNCSYEVTVASFKIFNKQTFHPQEEFDSKTKIVRPNDSVGFDVRVPDCSYQLDAYVGDNGKREGIPFVNGGDSRRRNLDKHVCQDDKEPKPTPTATPTATKVPPTKTPTPTRTPTPTVSVTPIVTVTPTPGNTGGNTNNNTNTNTNDNTVNVNPVIENKVTNTVNSTNSTHTTERIIETKGGTTVYLAPEVKKTPDTGAGSLSLLSLLPTGLAGFLLRKKIA